MNLETARGTIEHVRTPDGVQVTVREWGNPKGPEILLIHGVAQSYLSFTRQISSELSRNFRLVAFDTRGHGASEKPLEHLYYHDAQRWADEVQAVMDAKRLSKPILVGWSMGGRIIGQYLSIFGDRRLSGINFVAARVIADPSFSGAAVKALPALVPFDLESHIDFAAAFLRACFHKPPTDAEFAKALAYNMVTPLEVREAIKDWPANIPATIDALRAVRVPVLVTHGRADGVVLPAAAERTLSLVPHAKASWYEECGHSPFWEETSRFNRELAAFATASWMPEI